MQVNQVIDWLRGARAEQSARAVALLLGIWVLYRMAVLVWQLVPAPALPDVALEPPPVQPVQQTRGPRVDINQVVNWHLFGTPSAQPAQASNAPIDAPETRLNLVLRGVLSSHDAENARAIIAEPNGNENFFRIGSALPGGAELAEIYADRIILKRAGRHETLRLPREGVEGAVATPEPSPSTSSAGPSEHAGEVLRDYRVRMAEDPQTLLDLARPVPFSDANGFAGFRLFPGNKPTLFRELGLQPGDLVKEVNGVVLDYALRGQEIMQALNTQTQLSLRILRGAEEVNLQVDIPQ